ncbi:MAG: beta-galactosidase, partial [Planctomycetes bacterium]|nr:beta-galactosidase [Planctomycetota bacterium]
LSLDYTTCMTWASNRLGGMVDGPIYRRAQGAMEEDIAAEILDKLKRDYDVIVVGNIDWCILPREVEYAILKKVHDGTGLVCANHAAGRTETLEGILASEPVDDASAISGGVPLKALPALGLRERGGEGIGEILALRRLKRGRVAFLGFPGRAQTEPGRLAMLNPKLPRFTFLTPAMGFVGERELLHYEYYLSLGIKTMLWAAGKGPAVHIESIGPDDVTLKRDELAQAVVTITTRADQALQGVTVRLAVRDELGKEEHEAKKSFNLQQGRSTISFPMPSLKVGRHFVDAFVEKDGKIVNWGSSCFDVSSELFVSEVTLEKASYEQREEVRGKVILSEPGGNALKLRLSVADTLGRVAWTGTLEAAAREIPFAFRLEHPLAIMQNLTARLLKDDDVIAEARTEFSVRLRNWDDHSFMIWGYDFGPYSPTEYWLLRQLRGWGVDTISNCAPHPELARGIALANLYAIPYATRYAVGKGQTDLVRRPCLTDPSWQKGEKERLIERAKSFAPYGPFAYSLGDENFLGRNDLDICFSPTCQADFREYLQRRYGSLQTLNKEYGTQHTAWEQVKPITLADARNDGMLPLWADHRMHMEEVFVGAHRTATQAIRGVDPTARVGFDGPAFWLSWSWSGMNWWEFAKFFDLLNLYSQHTVGLEIVRSFAKKGTIVCSWYGGYFYANRCGSGWQRNEDMQRFFPWWMAFHGGTATAWYNSWGSPPETGVAPDLSAYPCFQWAIEEANELKTGVGKLLMNAERLHDGIAIHYSQASAHASTIEHSLTSIAKSQQNFLPALEDLGFQYEFMSYEQIESGALQRDRWRVLVLPYSQAVSGKEAEGIREFVRGGGLV